MKQTKWKYVAATPCETVKAWGCVFGAFSEQAATPIHRLEVPVSEAVILLCCGEPITVQPALYPGGSAGLSAFSAGLQVGAQQVRHAGVNDCIEIRLPPLALYALFGGAVAESNREAVNLLDVAPHETTRLLDHLRAARPWNERLAAVDRFLAREFCESKRRIPGELAWAWDAMDRSYGQTSIRALAARIGWSDRHFTKQFRAYFGVAPKAAARRLRFSHAFHMISDTTGELGAIAASAGFSDQSHMTREFQEFAGSSPRALRMARFDDLPGIPAGVLLNS